MKKKILIAVCVLAILLTLGAFYLKNSNQSDIDVTACSSETLDIMNRFHDGENYSAVVVLLDGMHLKYAVWKDGGEISQQQSAEVSGPFEIVARTNAKRNFGFLVGRREDILIFFDQAKTVTRRECRVVLTGP